VCGSIEEAHERLARGPLIFAGRIAQAQELIGRFTAEGRLPERMLDCGDLELVKSLTMAGIGVGLLPRRVATYGHDGKLRELHPVFAEIPDTIVLIYRSDLHRTRAATRVRDALIEYGRSL